MATIVSHAAVPLAVAMGLGKRRIPWPLVIAGVIAAIAPDADVILFRFGATYDTVWAHRGFTHSMGFALLAALVTVSLLRTVAPRVAFTFVAFSALSHGLLDMLTNGGHGIAILWPATPKRYFFEWRPIEVSPLSAARFVGRASRIARSEFLWIWVPASIVALGLRAFRQPNGVSL